MSAAGQSGNGVTPASCPLYSPIADIGQCRRDVRFVPEADACFFTRPVSFSGRPLRSSFAGNHTPIIAWLVGRDELFKRGEETYLSAAW